jgi:hypothetical protein
MAKLRTREEFYADLKIEVTRTLRTVPFHYYKTYAGTVEYGHLLHPGDYQRLMLWLEWSLAPPRMGRQKPWVVWPPASSTDDHGGD